MSNWDEMLNEWSEARHDGSADDDTDFVKMVERSGAVIVTDDHCPGSRCFWNNVVLDGLAQA
jgi:hypothetical protein